MALSVPLKVRLADKANYGSKRNVANIKYIVIHYTANDGDTDEGNGKYFANNVVKASAHFFVDDDSITQSVPDNYVGYSVGGNKYADCPQTGGGKFYKKCTNSNSISIEICDDVKNGTVYPSAKTIANALELTKDLMEKYNIPQDRVIRHFDVNGKKCPAYWCGTEEKNAKWKSEFWDKLPVAESKFPYLVKINTAALNVRKGAGASYGVACVVKQNEIYTIVDEKNGFGKLKSGAGWISLDHCTKL
jgi:N-acetylmuramoyl-L-alanine amidase CwlA